MSGPPLPSRSRTPPARACCDLALLSVAQHREASRSALRFFDTLIGIVMHPQRVAQAPTQASLAALRTLLAHHGHQLVAAIITAIAGAVPASRVRIVAPLLKVLIEMEHSTCRTWASTTVQGMPAETHADGAVFIGAIFSREALCQEKVVINACEAFSEACRRRRPSTDR